MDEKIRREIKERLKEKLNHKTQEETVYSGMISLRVAPDLHEKIYTNAHKYNISVNKYLVWILEQVLED